MEARIEQLDAGPTPVTDGWFVVSIPDAAWVTNEALGAACIFEGDDAPFPDVGFTLSVLQPGHAGGRYHREANQEELPRPRRRSPPRTVSVRAAGYKLAYKISICRHFASRRWATFGP